MDAHDSPFFEEEERNHHTTTRDLGNAPKVRAIDDVAVKQVGILIANDQNVVIEQGMMTQTPGDKTHWLYKATKDAGTQHVKLVVDAADLASQITTLSADKNL